ncbi:cell division protein FtsX [Roseobacter denitrificans]|uniref:Cell division permease, putative n=1 Tax=Roseobacter denitrificans (strain ATCC 33942 / OCh 114) TaxID=375451 RepID=Q169W6_ROSDO|nr:FtsX-like permease family protein [Roseobacter denitrificans]ABG31227.1 cell division permease, putative [Roseobacter denitrificans OCh 114]AVL54275.1 cell division protein FtsX [Roseobacter denitrificans]SFF98196.1 cell division transport system permease protein [Roseobacter denitrificans OCh 114]
MGVKEIVLGDRGADRVVPPSGFTAQLIVFAAGAMAFLAVFALALSLASGRLAARWGDELAQSSTIRIVAPPEQRADQTALTLRILETTAGVAFARALDTDEQRALLAPWFGPELDLDALPVPQLIEVIQESSGFDAAGLRLRLAAEVPGAVFDDHQQWRAPLVQSARRLNALGVVSVLLLAASMAAMVTLAANAALAANAQVISVLRLVGATDQFIARAFIRRFTLRALAGAAGGMVLGMGAVLLLPPASDAGGFLTGLGFQGGQWLLPLLIPVLAAAVAFSATGWAARRVLKELS